MVLKKAAEAKQLIDGMPQDKNALIKRPENAPMVLCIDSAATQEHILQSEKFIVDMIDVLENTTIDMITVSQPLHKRRGPRLVSRDEAYILKLLYRGKEPEDIIKDSGFKKYSLAQIKRLQNKMFIGDRSLRA